MKRLFVLGLIAVAVSGCAKSMVVYNGCNGSWLRVSDGQGRLLVGRLNYGLETTVDISGYSGSNIQLFAAGFELVTNRPLGSTTTSRYISSSGSPTGPSLQPWQITSLQSSDPNGGCRR